MSGSTTVHLSIHLLKNILVAFQMSIRNKIVINICLDVFFWYVDISFQLLWVNAKDMITGPYVRNYRPWWTLILICLCKTFSLCKRLIFDQCFILSYFLCGIWKFPGQELNLHCSSDPKGLSSNIGPYRPAVPQETSFVL